jgi:hypothetical protein
MAEVFLAKTGQLSQASRRDLKRAGVVVVEVEDPAACQFIRATEAVGADDMIWAALEALCSQTGSSAASAQRERLTYNLYHLIKAARQVAP